MCLIFSLLVLYVHILISTLGFPGRAKSPNGTLKESTFFLNEKVLSYDAEQFKLQPSVHSGTVKVICHGKWSGLCVCVCVLV